MPSDRDRIISTVMETFDAGAIAALYADELLKRNTMFANGRACGLHEAAGHVRSRSVDNWGAASGSPSTILCTVSDELYERAAQATQLAAAPTDEGGV